MSKLSKVRLHKLFQLAQHLLVAESQIAEGSDLLEPFHGVFGIKAICMFDAATEGLYTIGSFARDLEIRTRAAYTSGRDAEDRKAGVTIRCLTVDGRITGAIAFQGLEDAELTSRPLILLVSALQERWRVRRILRDELKNGLTAILAAAGGLREAGPLSAAQLDMALMVEEEASRLADATSLADRAARMEQDEIHVRKGSGQSGSEKAPEDS